MGVFWFSFLSEWLINVGELRSMFRGLSSGRGAQTALWLEGLDCPPEQGLLALTMS